MLAAIAYPHKQLLRRDSKFLLCRQFRGPEAEHVIEENSMDYLRSSEGGMIWG